jgi:hypothetical protein
MDQSTYAALPAHESGHVLDDANDGDIDLAAEIDLLAHVD